MPLVWEILKVVKTERHSSVRPTQEFRAMAETPHKVEDYADLLDESLGRAPFELCGVKTPGGRNLVDAFMGPRSHGLAEEDCPPWYWAQLLVRQAIRALRDAGWTVEPPSSLKDAVPKEPGNG